MVGRRAFLVTAATLLAATGVALPAQAQTPTATGPVGAPPKAYIVVDHASGAVMAASNERTPLPPASLTKIITALTAVAALGPTATVPVSARAAAMPAHKLNMRAGDVWPIDHVLAGVMASSANDAAATLAERVSGTLEDFHVALGQLATHLQMADAPVLQDSAGLDDYSSVKGGNLISARDLAIAARALLNEPRLAPLAARPLTEFIDVSGKARKLTNHNKLLARYPGAIGMKTGYTKKSGRGLIAAATRNGRTQIAVVMNVADTYGWAATLLDQAFAAPVPATGDRLPAIRPGLKIKAARTVIDALPRASRTDATALAAGTTAADTSNAAANNAAAKKPTSNGGLPLLVKLPLYLFVVLFLAVVGLRTRVLIRRRIRRKRRQEARLRRQAALRRDQDRIYYPHNDPAEQYTTLGR